MLYTHIMKKHQYINLPCKQNNFRYFNWTVRALPYKLFKKFTRKERSYERCAKTMRNRYTGIINSFLSTLYLLLTVLQNTVTTKLKALREMLKVTKILNASETVFYIFLLTNPL